MEKIDIVSDYDDLLTNLEECNQALSLVWSWLNKTIDINDKVAIFSFFTEQNSRLAVLNLVMEKLDKLYTEHHEKVEQAIKEG